MTSAAQERFTDLYNATSPRVYAYLRRHADPETAENVMAEVYVKAWRHFDSLTDNPMGWLIVTAHRTLLDHIRAGQRRLRLADDVFALAPDLTTAGVDGAAVDRAHVRHALAQLSDNDRQALLLVGWDGLDHQTAARIAGCSASAFSVRLNRARSRLAALLDDDPDATGTLTDSLVAPARKGPGHDSID